MKKRLVSSILSFALMFSALISVGNINVFANEKLIEYVEAAYEAFSDKLLQNETHLNLNYDVNIKTNGTETQKIEMLIDYMHSLEDNQQAILSVNLVTTDKTGFFIGGEAEVETYELNLNAFYKDDYIHALAKQDDEIIFSFRQEIGSLDEVLEQIKVLYEPYIEESEALQQSYEEQGFNQHDIYSSIVEEDDTIVLTMNKDDLFSYLEKMGMLENMMQGLVELDIEDQIDFDVKIVFAKDGDQYIFNKIYFNVVTLENEDEIEISGEVTFEFKSEMNFEFPEFPEELDSI